MIDLHLHTYYSDGTLSPGELVLLAKNLGAETIAITDHDGMDGIPEGLEAGKRYGVRVIPGIELSAEDDQGTNMHILGYHIDIKNRALVEEVEQIREKRKIRNSRLLEALRGIGCYLGKEDLMLREGQDYIGKPTFALALKNKGYVKEAKDAFQEGYYMRSPAVRKIHREKIGAEKAINLIKNAGGIPVLAHPMQINTLRKGASDDKEFFLKLEGLIEKLISWGLEGMECYYSKHLSEETAELLRLADKHRLKVTAGSDFHGQELDKDLMIGGYSVDPEFHGRIIL